MRHVAWRNLSTCADVKFDSQSPKGVRHTSEGQRPGYQGEPPKFGPERAIQIKLRATLHPLYRAVESKPGCRIYQVTKLSKIGIPYLILYLKEIGNGNIHMGKSRRIIICRNFKEIPSVGELGRSVTKESPLGLQFPFPHTDARYAELEQIIRERAEQLPNHSLFYSGGTEYTTNITILKVVNEQVVLTYTEIFLNAIEQYFATGNDLVTRLARHLNYPQKQITELWVTKLECSQHRGQVGDDWKYGFHGLGCRFWNTATGQTVDFTLRDYGKAMAIPDPYFLAMFIETTPVLKKELSQVVDFDFHDMRQVLHVLIKHNYVTDNPDND